MVTREEVLVAQEQRVEGELGSIPEWEHNLTEWSHQLVDRDTWLQNQEHQLCEEQTTL